VAPVPTRHRFVAESEGTIYIQDVSHESLIHPRAGDAAAAVLAEWEPYVSARSPLEAAQGLLRLQSAIDDLASWLDGEQ